MRTFIAKHSTVILLSGLLILLILARVFPTLGLKLGITFLILSFLIASLVVLEKHKKGYRNRTMTRSVFIRNAALEISGTFVVMLLAALASRSIAEVATQQVANDIIRMVAGLVVGLLVGLTIGFLARKMLTRLVEVSPGA